MLDAAYNESAMSQASAYHWYNKFKSSRKNAELMGRPGAPIKALTEQMINTCIIMILDDPHLTVRQIASLLDISVESARTFLLTELNFSRVCSMDFTFTLTTTKKCSH